MDPCPFVRIVIANLGLRLSSDTNSDLSLYCKFILKGFSPQVSDVPVSVENKIHGCFALRRSDIVEKPTKFSHLKIEILRRRNGGCGFVRSRKLLGRVDLQLDLKGMLEGNRAPVFHNGWVSIGGSGTKLHLNVRAEPDPRFVFHFDGDPECSPQVFQVNGNVRQPVFTCKFGFRNSAERNLRSSRSEISSSTNCFSSAANDDEQPLKERKGWSVTVHDLSGSSVAAASMVTPFVPSPGTDKVCRSNPGAWLILRPDHGTWKPWGRLEAWRERGRRVGYRFDLIPDGGIETIPLANSSVATNSGGKFVIDIRNGPTPMASPNSSFDFSSGSGSGSEPGSTSGSGSWAHLLYRGFVMSSTVRGDGGGGPPDVEVGVQHVSCTEDAAAFVALAAALDLSVDACQSFSRKLRKELRQPESA